MKLGQKLLLLVIFTMLICGICFAADEDRNQIILEHTSNDIVQVSVKLKKDASVASFQIGLEIKGYSDDVYFRWNQSLLNEGELLESTYDKGTLNLYYVGTEELNDTNEFIVGEIEFDDSSNYSVSVTPIADKTFFSSISHKDDAEIVVENNDKLSFEIDKKSSSKKKVVTEELELDNFMKENNELDSLAISLRSSTEMANKNIFALGDKVTYYIDYKNGGKDVDDKITIKLELPLEFKTTRNDNASISKSNKTLTWTLNGLKAGESGTKEVKIEYTSLKHSDDYSKEIVKATISVKDSKKDESAVVNMIVKDYNVELDETHEPYMRGDSTGTFRPDSTMTRGEAAIVLTRIFGINTNFTDDALAFPDLANTYPEARNAVRAAVQSGLVTGYPDGTYKPDNPMTWAEFLAIIARQVEIEYKDGFEIKELEDLVTIYKDSDKTGYLNTEEHWGVIYATLLARLNMTPLTSKNTDLKLDSYITRAEVAQLVNYYLFRAPAKSAYVTSSKFTDVPSSHRLIEDIIEATRDSHEMSITEKGYEN